MIKMCEIIYEDVEPNEEYEKTIKKVIKNAEMHAKNSFISS